MEEAADTDRRRRLVSLWEWMPQAGLVLAVLAVIFIVACIILGPPTPSEWTDLGGGLRERTVNGVTCYALYNSGLSCVPERTAP